jgi:hypothetical protein
MFSDAGSTPAASTIFLTIVTYTKGITYFLVIPFLFARATITGKLFTTVDWTLKQNF